METTREVREVGEMRVEIKKAQSSDEAMGEMYARLDILERVTNDMRVRTVLEQNVRRP